MRVNYKGTKDTKAAQRREIEEGRQPLFASLSLRSLTPLCATFAFFVPLWFIRGAEQAAPVFVLQTTAGTPVTGPLRQLGDDWSVRVGDVATDGQDVVALRRADLPLPPYPQQEQLLFSNGDRLPGHVIGLDGEKVRARLPGIGAGKDVLLPLSALSVVWFQAPDDADHPDLLRRQMAWGQRRRDLALLRNSDNVEGIFTGLDDKSVTLEVDQKTTSLARAKAAAVALSTELAQPLRPKGPYGRLVLADGARLSLTAPSCPDGAAITGTTLFGAAVRVPVGQVVGLYVYQGSAVYLSDLKPRRFEHTPFLDASWPMVNDGNVAGGDLRLGDSIYDKGLGLHSASRLTYDLGGGYRRFEAVVGVDAQAGGRGGARIKVLVDGKPQEDREISAGDGAVPVRVALRGARELTLTIEFGLGKDVGGWVDWADARLIK
jgi:hypothetical protein